MITFDYHAHLLGWWLLLPLALTILSVWLSLKFGRLSFLAAASTALALVISLLYVASRNTHYDCLIQSNQTYPNGRVYNWNLTFISKVGGLAICLDGPSGPTQAPAGPIEIHLCRYDSAQLYYPLWNFNLSLVNSDFLQRKLGFQICYGPATPSFNLSIYTLTIPHWFALLFCIFFPLLWLRRLLRQRGRARDGLCLHCGYDLRASKENCPECGTQIPPIPGSTSPAQPTMKD